MAKEQDRLVRKSDLDEAKADLRREMKLWLGAGSAVGTALAGLIGAFASGSGVAPAVETARGAAGILFGF